MNNSDSKYFQFRQTVHIVKLQTGHISPRFEVPEGATVIGSLPPIYPEWLGDRTFQETHRVRFPYVGGAMANGITSTEMVKALAHEGMLCFFGAAGLGYEKVATAVSELKNHLDPLELSWGCNLIHSPNEPELEARVAELYLNQGVKRVSASAYIQLTLPIIQYACTGLRKNARGQIQRKHYVFAKISRPEVARLFMSPAPEALLKTLFQMGKLTAEEVRLAREIPLAEDITVEADSGGHTDKQALPVIYSIISDLRNQLCQQFNYQRPIRVGAAGGLGSPRALAGAFSMGAAYVLTGSVNQACIESGLHKIGRQQLALAQIGDVTMTPASDMFEQGVKLQVLKKGTMYPNRAAKLYDLYVNYKSIEAIPSDIQAQLEKDIFQKSIAVVWQETQAFWHKRDPKQVEKAQKDPKHKMALVFRSYLGLSSQWAIEGIKERRLDYQIWCGPAITDFNQWTKGSFLEKPENRTVVQVALNLLEGAAVYLRASQLRTYGVTIQNESFHFKPRRISLNTIQNSKTA